MRDDETLRREFICRVFRMEEHERGHLLAIEQDDEIRELHRVAMQFAHYDMAVVLTRELQRRFENKNVAVAYWQTLPFCATFGHRFDRHASDCLSPRPPS